MSFSKDPDMQRFITDLQNSGPGVRWRRAWVEMQRIVRTIKEIDKHTTPDIRAAHLLILQRRYIRASDFASEALDELTLVYAWPPEATANVAFRWVAPARRQSRKAP